MRSCLRLGVEHIELIAYKRHEVAMMYNQQFNEEELDFACEFHEKKRKELLKRLKADRQILAKDPNWATNEEGDLIE